MTDILPVSAISAATPVADPSLAVGAVSPVADPSAVARFEAAMAAESPAPVADPDPIPFASEATAAWRSSQINHQGILHRIRALSALGANHGPASIELLELQYEVANLSFQQQVVTKVADKTSSAIQTLIKNQ